MRIAVFTKNFTNPAYGAARLGADRAAAALGAMAEHYVPRTPDDPGEQSALIDRALATRPDAFVLSPVHPTRVDAAIGRIADAGIPMVGIVSPIEAAPSVSFVGADDVRLGGEIAEYLLRHLDGRGRVLVITGPVGSATSIDRLRGFRESAARWPGVELAGRIAGDYDRQVAKRRTAQWLAEHAAPDACLAANDAMALGAIEAFDAAGCRAIVVGVNAIPEAIAAIGCGRMLATADFSAMQIAYLGTECAVRHLRGEPVPARLELPVQIVDQGNFTRWDKPYEERALYTLAELASIR